MTLKAGIRPLIAVLLPLLLESFNMNHSFILSKYFFMKNSIDQVSKSTGNNASRYRTVAPNISTQIQGQSINVQKFKAIDTPTSPKNTTRFNSAHTVRSQVKKMYRLACDELRLGNAKKCIDILNNALAADGSDSHSWLLLGRAFARIGDTEKARTTFTQATEKCPRSVHILQAWAVLEQKYGNIEKARELFTKGLSIEPANVYICHAWGLMEQRLDNIDKAKELFREAFDKSPQEQVCTALAELEAYSGDVATARAVFRSGIERCSRKGQIYLSWASVEEKVAGNFELSEKLLQSAMEEDESNVKVYISRAKLEMRRGNIAHALDILNKASGLPQQNGQLFNMWAMLEQRNGNLKKAQEVIRQARERFPGEQSLLQTEGTIEERLGNYSKAVELYRKSTLLRPTAPAFVAWAILEDKMAGLKAAESPTSGDQSSCQSDGREMARHLFEMGIKADPKHGPLYNAFGMMEAKLGHMRAAQEVFRRGIEAQCTDMTSVWHGLGSVELRQGNVYLARQLFQRAMAESAPTDDISFLSHSLGALELSLHNPARAREAFKVGLARCPTNSPLLLGAALAEVRLGCVDEARKFFTRAVQANRVHAHAWQAWGVLESREGNPEAARELFEGGIRAVPTHSALWQAYGMLEMTLGNVEKARKILRTGIQKCRGHSSVVRLLQSWACFEVRFNEIDTARKLITEAIEVEPNHGPCWTVRAAIEEKVGDLSKAREIYEEGIKADPTHGPLYRCYATMEASSGNYEKARRLFDEGIRVAPHHAQLYHKFAEFEASIGNIQGLSELNKKAKAFFNSKKHRTARISAGRALRSLSCVEDYFDYVGERDHDTEVEDMCESERAND